MIRVSSLGLPVLLGLAALAGGLALAAALAEPSALLGVAAAVALLLALLMVLTRQPRRALIGALFFLAPMDISKALVAPLQQFYSPGLYLTLGELVLLLLFALWLSHRVVVLRRPPPLTGLDALALAFVAVVWARSFGSAQGGLALASAVSYSLAVLAFYVASHVLATPRDLRLALQATLAVLLLEAVYVGAQMAAHSPLPLPGSKVVALGGTVTFGGTGEAFRPSGFLSHPNALAHHMTLLLPPALALVLLGAKRLPRSVWLGAALALAVAGSLLLLTLSRGGWASFLLGGSLVAVVYLKRGLLLPRQLGAAAVVFGLAAIAFVAVYPQVLLRLTEPDDRSTESRLLLVDQAVTIIGANPWFGVGFGGYNRAAYEFISPSFGSISEDYQRSLLQLVVHNHYLLLAAELGVPAMLFFVYLLWRWLRLPVRVRQWHDPAAFALATGLAGSMLSQMLFLNSDNYYADIRVFLLWLAAGVLQAVTLQAQRQAQAPPLHAPLRAAAA